jgi:hypothetical protein
MTKYQRIYGQLELSQNGRLANVRTREELFRILGFCSSNGTPVAIDSQSGEVLEVSEDKSAYPGSDNSDSMRHLSDLMTRTAGRRLDRQDKKNDRVTSRNSEADVIARAQGREP